MLSLYSTLITLTLFIIRVKTEIQNIENISNGEENNKINQIPVLHVNIPENPNDAMFDPFENLAKQMIRTYY